MAGFGKKSGVDGLERFFKRFQQICATAFIKPAQGTHAGQKQVSAQGNLKHSVVNHTVVAFQAQEIGAAVFVRSASGGDVLDLLPFVGDVKALPGYGIAFFVIVGAFRKNASPELEFSAMIIGQYYLLHIVA